MSLKGQLNVSKIRSTKRYIFFIIKIQLKCNKSDPITLKPTIAIIEAELPGHVAVWLF
jgi:hypothetical protein